VTSKEEALRIARDWAAAHRVRWSAPVSAQYLHGGAGAYWLICSNSPGIESSVRVKIDDRSGVLFETSAALR
jgi:hypothetical protein